MTESQPDKKARKARLAVKRAGKRYRGEKRNLHFGRKMTGNTNPRLSILPRVHQNFDGNGKLRQARRVAHDQAKAQPVGLRASAAAAMAMLGAFAAPRSGGIFKRGPRGT